MKNENKNNNNGSLTRLFQWIIISLLFIQHSGKMLIYPKFITDITHNSANNNFLKDFLHKLASIKKKLLGDAKFKKEEKTSVTDVNHLKINNFCLSSSFQFL